MAIEIVDLSDKNGDVPYLGKRLQEGNLQLDWLQCLHVQGGRNSDVTRGNLTLTARKIGYCQQHESILNMFKTHTLSYNIYIPIGSMYGIYANMNGVY